MKVRLKKLDPKAVVPKKAHLTDAGFDLVATSMEIDADGNLCYGFGIAVEIPKGYVGLIFPRSSNAKKDLALSNCVGCIDSGYRGEIKAKFKAAFNCQWGALGVLSVTKAKSLRVYEVGDRIAQIIIMPYPEVEFEEADELSESDRGEGGYGSTGR